MHTAVTRSSACALGRVAVAGFASVGWLGFRCFLALALMHRAQVALFYVAQCLTLRSSGPAFCGPLTLSVERLLTRLTVGHSWPGAETQSWGVNLIYALTGRQDSLPRNVRIDSIA